MDDNKNNNINWSLKSLVSLIQQRKKNESSDSYTSTLLHGDIDQILKKFGEEAFELIIAAKNSTDHKSIKYEAADLMYHFWVLMTYFDISLEDIELELSKRSGRSGLAEKASRVNK